MKPTLKVYLAAVALFAGTAARATTCDSNGYDPNINGPSATSCSMTVHYGQQQANDYDVPVSEHPGIAHEAGSGSGEPDKHVATDTKSMDFFETIWTAA